MATRQDIVKLALDTYHNRVSGNFSNAESNEVLRKALIDANGGSDKIDIKSLRGEKGAELFAILEEVIQKTVIEGLTGDEFFMNLVEYHNIATGDAKEFYIPDNSLFYVADTAVGTQGVRRQRLNGGTRVTIPTTFKTVKIYEELNRVLSGRVDFNTFIDRVTASTKKKMLDDVYKVWNAIETSAGSKYFPTAGAVSEDALLEMIDHVEAATGKRATVYGTRQALRKIPTAIVSNMAKDDMYNMGYYGKFNGTPLVSIKQVHETGTDNFLLNNKKLYVIAGDDKPIKVVTEGDSLIIMGNPMNNADLSQEFLYGTTYGVGMAMADKFGIYTIE